MTYTLSFPLIDRHAVTEKNPDITFGKYSAEYSRIVLNGKRRLLNQVATSYGRMTKVFSTKAELVKFMAENQIEETFLPSEFSIQKNRKQIVLTPRKHEQLLSEKGPMFVR